MGKFYISMIVASMFATSTLAQQTFSMSPRTQEQLPCVVKQVVNKQLQAKPLGLFVRTNQTTRATTDLPEIIITQQPAGTLHKAMYEESKGYYVNAFDVLYDSNVDGGAVDVVEGDDGAIYIKNPFGSLITDSWIKGEKGEKDTIVFELPQLVLDYISSSDGTRKKYYAQNVWKELTSEGIIAGVDTENNKIKFTWRNDTLCKVDTLLMGVTDEYGQWTGYGDYTKNIYPVGDVAPAPDSQVGEQRYKMDYNNGPTDQGKKFVNVVKTEHELYIKGLYSTTDLWLKGSILDGEVKFDKQYMGVDEKQLMHIYFMPSHADSTFDEVAQQWNITYTPTQETTYDYDAEQGTLHTNSSFALNKGKNMTDSPEFYSATTFAPWEDKTATPSSPAILNFMSYNEVKGYGGIMFMMSPQDVDGGDLDEGNLYYRIYFDDKVFTFTPDKYVKLTDEVTDVPYQYSDNLDIVANGNIRIVYYFDNNFNTIGVQAVYKGGGQTTTSDIVSYDNPLSSVATTRMGDTIQQVYFTDLSGRKVSKPVTGLYIKTTTFNNGVVKSEKVVVK